jgi:predicted transcriptional regulator
MSSDTGMDQEVKDEVDTESKVTPEVTTEKKEAVPSGQLYKSMRRRHNRRVTKKKFLHAVRKQRKSDIKRGIHC